MRDARRAIRPAAVSSRERALEHAARRTASTTPSLLDERSRTRGRRRTGDSATRGLDRHDALNFIGSYTSAPWPGRSRVVIAKPGLDGHDRGAKIIARALRDAGMEVIYTGLHQTPEQIVETAIQEDADAVGISILSGAHMTLVPRILELLRENGAEDVLVVVGGTIPGDDADELKRLGVADVFGPGAPTSEIVEFLSRARCRRLIDVDATAASPSSRSTGRTR